MSDGPYKTLPMRPKWKALSQRADNQAFTPDQVAVAVCPALAGDWAADISTRLLRELRSALAGAELFADLAFHSLEVVRGTTETPLAAGLVDAARNAAAEGLLGERALEQAAADALSEQALRGVRQVEEHWLRKASQKRSGQVRIRLEGAVAAAQIGDLAKSLLNGTVRALRPEKHSGLDDGVAL